MTKPVNVCAAPFQKQIPAQLRCAEFDCQVPLAQLKGNIAIFDCNQLKELRNAPRNGINELGDVLANMAAPASRYKGVVILPALIENYYSTENASPELIDGHRQHWMAEHFTPRNMPEVSPTFTASTLPAAQVADVLFMFLGSFWLLHKASMVFKNRKSKARKDAVTQFLATLQSSGLPPDGMFPTAVLSTALNGNTRAMAALHLQGDITELLNGAWDLTHWGVLALQWVASERTKLHPGLLTRDQNASALLHRAYRGASGQLQFFFDSPRVDAAADQASESLLKGLRRNYMEHATFVNYVLPALARECQNDKLDSAIRLFMQCDAQIEAGHVSPFARSRVSLPLSDKSSNVR